MDSKLSPGVLLAEPVAWPCPWLPHCSPETTQQQQPWPSATAGLDIESEECSLTVTTSSRRPTSRILGTKPAPIPWILWGPALAAEAELFPPHDAAMAGTD